MFGPPSVGAIGGPWEEGGFPPNPPLPPSSPPFPPFQYIPRPQGIVVPVRWGIASSVIAWSGVAVGVCHDRRCAPTRCRWAFAVGPWSCPLQNREVIGGFGVAQRRAPGGAGASVLGEGGGGGGAAEARGVVFRRFGQPFCQTVGRTRRMLQRIDRRVGRGTPAPLSLGASGGRGVRRRELGPQ